MSEENNKKKEVNHKHPFYEQLNKAVNKKIHLKDINGDEFVGILLAYTLPYLNVCVEIDDKIRFVRNVSWFEVITK